MPIYRRRNGLWQDITVPSAGRIATATATVLASAPIPDPTIRPTGPDYVTFESLYVAGDTQSDGTVDLSAILGRCPAAKIVTFPEGEFVVRDFRNDSTVFQAGVQIPATVRGIVGSGRGVLGGSFGTIFSMKPGSSTRAGLVPAQSTGQPNQLNLFKQLNQAYPGVWKNFQVRGTDQGHNYSTMQIYATAGANEFSDILVCGWQGDNGAPPGETIGLSINGTGAHVATRLECDGRRAVGGPVLGASGLTFQNNIGSTFVSCSSHHCRTGNFLGWQAFDCTMIGCTIDAASAGSYGIGNGGMNLERCGGWTFRDCNFIARSSRVHMTHSNDTYSLTQGGVTRSTTSDRGLTIINPTWNNAFGDGYLYIESWNPYGNGNLMGYPADAPLVVQSDGTTHIPYLWSLQQIFRGVVS